MKKIIDAFLARALVYWVDGVRRRARAVVVAMGLLTLALAGYTVLALGINSDNVSLVPDTLPSRQAHENFIRHFPNLEEALFVVIDASTPERARDAAAELTVELNRQSETIIEAYQPGSSDFFEKHGLLYRSVDELNDFADQMVRIQPLVSQLEINPNIDGMVRLLKDGLAEEQIDPASSEDWVVVLDRVSEATLATSHEYPVAVSWEEILLRDSALDISTRRVIVVHPILDYEDILLGRRPMQAIRDSAVELGLTPERGVRIRLTGTPALNYDEMIGIAWDVGVAGLFCFGMVAIVLRRALRSNRMVVATLLTLVAGLIWTAAFTAASIGTLNPLSITFAILFIGLGVDFGLHLGTGYMDQRRLGQDHASALQVAAAQVGSSLVICTLTTSIGFYVFVPTDYRGVAELGLIAGTGMFIILGLTLTLFPALISDVLSIHAKRDLEAAVRFKTEFWQRIARRPSTVRWCASAAALAALVIVSPGLRFNANAVDMRDPSTESVQAFRDLLSNSLTSPWYLNVLMPNLDEAIALGTTLESLPEVSHVITLGSFVPQDQADKIAILDDVNFLFEVPLVSHGDSAPLTTEEQIEALRSLRDELSPTLQQKKGQPLALAMARLRDHLDDFLLKIEMTETPEQSLAQLQAVLLDPFPEHLIRLRRSMQASEISFENLPNRVTQSMMTQEGLARIQVYPTSSLDDGPSLRRFVEVISSAAPNAAGVPLNLVEFGDLIRTSFFQALLSAAFIISLILWLMWRSFTDMLLVMAPLTLGSLLTTATARLLDIPLDFTNVVVLPLLFGIGVDSAIHLVHRHKEGATSGEDLLGTSTARAVFYSAFTTIVSFGSLAFAGQRGLASLGLMLSFGLFYTVTSVLIVLPALLDLRRPHVHPPSNLNPEPLKEKVSPPSSN
ncbi:MAG: hypothetical protein CL917_16790 [Deltaproteobacteria bacterium]|nr:hypothetical protein [Deltaproteobacteria bacterium]